MTVPASEFQNREPLVRFDGKLLGLLAERGLDFAEVSNHGEGFLTEGIGDDEHKW